jgi:hypothetical protein
MTFESSCINNLWVFGPEGDVLAFKQKALGLAVGEPGDGDENPPPNFSNLYPPPAGLSNRDEAEWRDENWGTTCVLLKKSKEAARTDGYARSITFVTLSSPPDKLIRNIGPLWPTLTFVLSYKDEFGEYQGLWSIHGATVEGLEVELEPA